MWPIPKLEMWHVFPGLKMQCCLYRVRNVTGLSPLPSVLDMLHPSLWSENSSMAISWVRSAVWPPLADLIMQFDISPELEIQQCIPQSKKCSVKLLRVRKNCIWRHFYTT